MQAILILEFFSNYFWNLLLNTGSMTRPNAFLSSLLVKWVCVHFFFVHVKVSNHTHLKMRVSTECPQFCPLEGCLPLYKWTTFSDALMKGLLLLLPLLLSRRPGFSRFVEATVSRCTPEGLPFVSTLLESCEPYSCFSMVGLEDSKRTSSKFSSFLRNCEP